MSNANQVADELAEICVRIDVATHRMLTLLREFDGSGEWGRQGALSVAHWLTWRTGMGLRAAQQKASVARALGELALVDQALAEGRISYTKARAICRVATPDNQAELIELAEYSTGQQLERICRRYKTIPRERDEQEAPPEDDRWRDGERRFFRRSGTPSGMIRIEVQLPVEEAEVVWETVHQLAKPDPATEAPEPTERPRSAERSAEEAEAKPPKRENYIERQRRLCDAFVDIMCAVRQAGPEFGTSAGGAVHDLIVLTDPASLQKAADAGPAGELEDGCVLSPPALRRLACDCGIFLATVDEQGKTVDVGRRTRTIPPATRRALRMRDRGCRFPGCCNRRSIDGHHVKHWADGGETNLDNLVSLCRRHHRLIHDEEFSVEAVDGTFIFRDRHGETIDRVPARPVDAASFQLSVWPKPELDPKAFGPKYEGGRVNYEFAISSLVDLERRRSKARSTREEPRRSSPR